MPTLIRFLTILVVLAGAVWGAMWALATFVEPQERDITIRVPAERLNPQPPSKGEK
ncbi:hypothetical protein [Oryzifoliimicrobium ureilyticus]|uniref:hypothetical protein n=1 Tax=Oryzifoliimicrobium ureilyticus TaxID=3113724 RepID=UPI0030766315